MEKINVLKGKMFHYSLLIQEIIQTIIDNKVSRENTNLSKELFLESSIRGEMKFLKDLILKSQNLTCYNSY